MAGKWAMAKAFGRAMMEPLKAKNAGKVREEVGGIAKKLDAGPREAYGEGVTEGFNDLGKALQFEKKRKIPELRKRMNELSDEATDKSLQNDFDEAIDEAIKYNTKYDPQRGRWTEEEVREGAIEFLKGGAKIEDVMDFLRGKIDYVKMKD